MIVIQKWEAALSGLAGGFRTTSRSCENPSFFDDYIRLCATTDMQTGRSVTYVAVDLCDENVPFALAGFISLRANAFVNNADRVGEPAIEITQLAVAENYCRQGLGEALVLKALEISLNLARNHVGVRYVVVRATKRARPFYEHARIGFRRADELYEAVPGEEWNRDCIPMYIKLLLEPMNASTEDGETEEM